MTHDINTLARELGSIARRAATDAGAMAMAAWARRDTLAFDEKSNGKQAHSDLVSEVDLASQRIVRDAVLQARPGDAFLGEEDLGEDPSTVTDASQAAPGQVLWVVDPIDATLNYAYGRGEWAVSVCARLDGVPVASAVAAPARGELFCAQGDRAWVETSSGSRDLVMGTPAPLARAMVEVGRGKPSKLTWMMSNLDGTVRDLRRGGCAALALCDVAAGRLDVCIQADLGEWDWAGGAHLVAAAGGEVSFWGPLMVAAGPGLAAEVAELLMSAPDMPGPA